jgi:hypothetical protein
MLKPTEEPLEPGKDRVKVPKKKTPGKKTPAKKYVPKETSIEEGAKKPAKPKVAEKVDILKGVDYDLREVTGAERVTDKQTHLLVLKKSDKVYKYSLYGKPDELEILRHWNAI